MSIARRPLLDLPMAANGGNPSMAANVPAHSTTAPPPAAPSGKAAAGYDQDAMRLAAAPDAPALAPDFDLSSTFDVPAFLRRQEG
jgi:hypothetical protein